MAAKFNIEHLYDMFSGPMTRVWCGECDDRADFDLDSDDVENWIAAHECPVAAKCAICGDGELDAGTTEHADCAADLVESLFQRLDAAYSERTR